MPICEDYTKCGWLDTKVHAVLLRARSEPLWALHVSISGDVLLAVCLSCTCRWPGQAGPAEIQGQPGHWRCRALGLEAE
jgi:hypothetical protein